MAPFVVIDRVAGLVLVGLFIASSSLALESAPPSLAPFVAPVSDLDATNVQTGPPKAASVAAAVVESAPDNPTVGAEAAEQDVLIAVPDRGPAVFADDAAARNYLIETARPGTTMLWQGPALAIGRLHPEFVVRLANAIWDARQNGLPSIGIESAYRPPAFGIGGFIDKFKSLHTYGLAVDMKGIGAPGSSEALLWHQVAARHGVMCPYGPYNRAEWNHCQPTRYKVILADNPLRDTVTADGPVDLEEMFDAGTSFIESKEALASAEPVLEQQAPPSAAKDSTRPPFSGLKSFGGLNKSGESFRSRMSRLPALARPEKIVVEERHAKFTGDRRKLVARHEVARLQTKKNPAQLKADKLQKAEKLPTKRFAALAPRRKHALN
jgi:hypothetical protein